VTECSAPGGAVEVGGETARRNAWVGQGSPSEPVTLSLQGCWTNVQPGETFGFRPENYQRVHGGHVDTYRARWLRSRADGQLEQLFPPISFGDKKEFQIYSKKSVSFPYFLFKIYLFILNRGTNHNYEPVTSSKILLDKR